MSNTNSRRARLWIPAAMLMTVACEPNTPKPPIMELTITSSYSYLNKLFGDNHTFALGVSELAPISEDPHDTLQYIFFDQPSDAPAPVRQEMLVFDVDWAQPILNPSPSEDYYYVPGVNFVSVLPDEFENTSNFDAHAVSSHAVRYWHGQCSIRQPWDELFDSLSVSILQGLADKSTNILVTSVTRNYDVMQPNFIGHHSIIEHGFTVEGYYEINTALIGDIVIEANPAYTFGVTGNGYVSVSSPHQGVVVINDVTNVKPAVQAAFANQVSDKIAEGINDALTFPLDLPLLGCNPNNALPQQQESCYDLVANFGDDVIRDALVDAGYSDAEATSKTASAIAGLRPANFTCEPEIAKCAFHPIVQRVNVLPDEFELVLVGEPEYSPQLEKDRVTLYEILPDLMGQLDGGPNLPPLCHGAMGRENGEIPVWQHGELSIDA